MVLSLLHIVFIFLRYFSNHLNQIEISMVKLSRATVFSNKSFARIVIRI